MKIILDIKDNKAQALIEILKDLAYVKFKIITETIEEKEPTKKEILDGIKQGLKEVELHRQGKLKLKSAKELLDEL
ncbi:hypothetical protein [Leptospira interrogans]|uniref:hypothetical protein n=1 Tax=Leptospira interrogans TaxID=173 RepID=UPI0002974427|nr:hypothetical protein [Leptospira interrogans]EKR17404.1 hypothetical protein LEP1GSC019_1686 [Leptospira interrogans serovar Pyrogenes str. 2006006960]MCL8312820.1 hypothetical protein [Leptospira interrogans]OQM33273.1 hypothetical protein DV38_02005 [Leptospira interrogans]QCO34407.1 hypothetical protein E4414_16060 [Leptospira interrogans]QCO34427.1 hypothetical protein E4414_16180 [Leptospira interrogans]